MALVKHGFREDEVLAMTGAQLDSYLEILLGHSGAGVTTQRYINQRRKRKG